MGKNWTCWTAKSTVWTIKIQIPFKRCIGNNMSWLRLKGHLLRASRSFLLFYKRTVVLSISSPFNLAKNMFPDDATVGRFTGTGTSFLLTSSLSMQKQPNRAKTYLYKWKLLTHVRHGRYQGTHTLIGLVFPFFVCNAVGNVTSCCRIVGMLYSAD